MDNLKIKLIGVVMMTKLKSKKTILFVLSIILLISLSGCFMQESGSNSGGFIYSILTLSFLPSGMEVIKGESLLHDASMTTTIIPIIGLIVNYFVVLMVNIIDFMIWFFSWIPGYRRLIAFISSAHDIDQKTGIIASWFTSHRNFFTHSVLNPILLIYFVISFHIKAAKGAFINFIIALPGLAFAGGILADTMPKSWAYNFSRIHIEAIGFNVITLSPLFSWLWLLFNALIILTLLAALIAETE